MKQLKILYDAIPTVINKNSFSALMQSPFALQLIGKEKNEEYPKKSYEKFLTEIIEKKQDEIKKYLSI